MRQAHPQKNLNSSTQQEHCWNKAWRRLLGDSQYNNIYRNILLNNVAGIECTISSNKNIHENCIEDSNVGISFSGSYYNRVYQNKITNCLTAVSIRGSHNRFYHNNFIDKNNKVSIRDTYLFTSDIITE